MHHKTFVIKSKRSRTDNAIIQYMYIHRLFIITLLFSYVNIFVLHCFFCQINQIAETLDRDSFPNKTRKIIYKSFYSTLILSNKKNQTTNAQKLCLCLLFHPFCCLCLHFHHLADKTTFAVATLTCFTTILTLPLNSNDIITTE